MLQESFLKYLSGEGNNQMINTSTSQFGNAMRATQPIIETNHSGVLHNNAIDQDVS
jgi:hypothetical protein